MVIYSKDTVKEQHFIMMMLYIMSLNMFEFLKTFSRQDVLYFISHPSNLVAVTLRLSTSRF